MGLVKNSGASKEEKVEVEGTMAERRSAMVAEGKVTSLFLASSPCSFVMSAEYYFAFIFDVRSSLMTGKFED